MARILDKDPATYGKERDGFVRDLQHFHETRGTPFRRCPTLGGHEVDLYLLYSLVTAQGGWMKVNSRNEWESIFEQFDFPSKCVNSGVALKQIYIRYLDRYEKVHYLGEEADRGSDDDEESRHKRWSARALHSVPLTYNYHQHNIADSTRTYNGLSDNLYKPSDYDRLALSLISPLPNEQDFAVNVCTLLCNEGKHTLKLDKCPRLVDHLLAHTGVFNHCSMRQLFTEVYSNIRKHSLNHFWYDVLESHEVLDLADENNYTKDKKAAISPASSSPPTKGKTKPILQPQATNEQKNETIDVIGALESQTENDIGDNANKEKCSDIAVASDSDSSSELFADEPCVSKTVTKGKGFKLKLEPADTELFCLGRTVGVQDYVGQRVLQIAQILRNLSFAEDNVPVLANNRTFIRFLLLCVSARWNSIHQLGLDMLSNVASELLLGDQNDRLTVCLLSFVTKGIHSQDRVVIIACLEILNKLSQRESNEEFLLRSLERRTYAQVCSFLTLHDVMLLIYTLECLYSLSSLGERACNFIVDVHGIIDTLVSLVTVEGKSYGPKACIGMKLVETVPGAANATGTPAATPAQTPQPTPVATTTNAPTPILNTPVRPATPRTIASTPIKATITQAQPITSTPMTQLQPQQQSPQQPSQLLPSQQSIQQQHAHQQAIQENEQFALAWLRATYEPCGHGKIEQQELYKQYLNSCAKIGRRGVIAPLHFPRCVRSVFGGTVGPNTIKGGESPNLQYYEGIRARIVPLIITLPSAALQQTANKAICAPRRGGKVVAPVNMVQTSIADNTIEHIPASPASPILKAQLSAPPKPRDSPSKVDIKSQVLAHPHLSQALLGNNVASASVSKESKDPAATATATPSSSPGQSNTSLIKSLLATKVNECMIPHNVSMKTTALSPAAAVQSQDSQSAVVAQVAQRQQQQRLLAQQNQQSSPALQTFTTVNKKVLPKPQPKADIKGKLSRVNGIRLPENESDNVSSTSQILENHIASPASLGGGATSAFRGRREPPQPPPPPLAPLSTGPVNSRAKTPRMDIEDSDSTGNNSIASSTGISSSNVALSGGISSTEDGENSLTSFEGILLNGIPNSIDIDAPCNDDSNSKDSIRNSSAPCKSSKPLMLADLLEKKVDKDPPILNGIAGKELRIGEKGLELVDNHINKILNKDMYHAESKEVSVIVSSENANDNIRTSDEVNSVFSKSDESQSEVKLGAKRPAEEDISEVDAKKRAVMSPSVIVSNNVNGVDSPKPDSLDSNGDDSGANVSVSATAANLYASLAADVLEDEDEELLQQEAAAAPSIPVPVEDTSAQMQVQMQSAPVHQVIAVGGQSDQQLIVTTPRQIIVSQGQIQSTGQQVLITAGGQLALQQGAASAAATIKTSAGHQGMPVLVQTGTTQQRTPMMLSQSNAPIIVSHGPQGQVQLVTSSTQPGQYVLSAGGTQGQTHYVVAQPQTALVQGQAQTVLVAQTPQQQGTPSKTIIILQPQTTTNTATHHQKVVVTPQGQQVVVTQVQRPILQTSTVTNNIPPALVPSTQIQSTACGTALIKTSQPTVITQNTPALLNTVMQNASAGKILLGGVTKDKSSRPQTPVASIDDKLASPGVSSLKALSTNQTVPTVIRDYSNPYICEWRGCISTKKFKSANEVYMHACEAHCPPTQNYEELQCLWERCDNMKRKRFSLMTHLHDRHCNAEIMKLMAARRKQLSQSGKTEIPPPAPPPPHPGYAPDAALHAIKRHALEFVNPKELQQRSTTKPGTAAAAVPTRPSTHSTEQDDNEGPVTKSIRLTASLILRNLVIYSNNSRRYLRHYEPHLAGVALSNVESSRTIAQLLYDMNDTSTSRR